MEFRQKAHKIQGGYYYGNGSTAQHERDKRVQQTECQRIRHEESVGEAV